MTGAQTGALVSKKRSFSLCHTRNPGADKRRSYPRWVMVEVQRRRAWVHRARVCAPGIAWAYLRPKATGLTKERFGILCLNARGEVIADLILAMGSPLGVVIMPREVMREALRYGATTVLAWHNHPAGAQNRWVQSHTKRAGLPSQRWVIGYSFLRLGPYAYTGMELFERGCHAHHSCPDPSEAGLH